MLDESARPRLVARLFNAVLFVAALLTALVALVELRKVGAPGAPVAWVYAAVAASVLTVLALYPKLFRRLPRRGRFAAGLMVPASIVLLSVEVNQMAPAWDRTPEGAKEIADQRARDAERTAEEAKAAADQAQREKTARQLAELEASKKQLEDIQARLEGCFTSFGHRLPALEDPVKASLHNPAAFEHVETVLIVPDDERNDVQMTFRAENAFGAIRTARVRAQLIPDDCSVQNIGEPEID